MKFLDILQTANSNLLRSKLRTILTLAAVFIATFTLTLTISIGEGVKDYFNKQFESVAPKDAISVSKSRGIDTSSSDEPAEYNPNRTASGFQLLTQKDIDNFEETEGIKSVQPSYRLNAEYFTDAQENKRAINLEFFLEGYNFALAAGNFPEQENEILIPYNYISVLDAESPSDSIGREIEVHFQDTEENLFVETFVISGVTTESVFDAFIGTRSHITFDKYKELSLKQYEEQDSFFNAIGTLEEGLSESQVNEIKKALDEKGLNANTSQDFIDQFNTTITFAQVIFGVFALIALLAATLGIINTLLMSVYERTREIGLMKAVGTKATTVFAMFSLEALSIGFWGSILGVASAIVVGNITNVVAARTILENFEGFDLMSYPIPLILLVTLITMLISFLAGTLPAIKASRLDPINALRYE